MYIDRLDKLDKRELGDILEDIVGTARFDELPEEEQRRREGGIKSNRHRLLERSRRYG